RDALAERDALRVLDAVGEHARDEVGLRLGRMAGGAHRELLVDAAIHVGQLDLEGVHRRSGGHVLSLGMPCPHPVRRGAAPRRNCPTALSVRSPSRPESTSPELTSVTSPLTVA